MTTLQEFFCNVILANDAIAMLLRAPALGSARFVMLLFNLTCICVAVCCRTFVRDFSMDVECLECLRLVAAHRVEQSKEHDFIDSRCSQR